jgi:hypothetical protein
MKTIGVFGLPIQNILMPSIVQFPRNMASTHLPFYIVNMDHKVAKLKKVHNRYDILLTILYFRFYNHVYQRTLLRWE